MFWLAVYKNTHLNIFVKKSLLKILKDYSVTSISKAVLLKVIVLQVEEEVFKQAYIPKRLTEVVDFERDINLAKSGEGNDLVYKTLVGLKADLSGTVQKPEILDSKDEEDSGSDSESNSDEDSEDSDEKSKFVDSSRPKHETIDEKKARKRAVKEAKAEKRKTKVKKHVKKRIEKNKKKQ